MTRKIPTILLLIIGMLCSGLLPGHDTAGALSPYDRYGWNQETVQDLLDEDPPATPESYKGSWETGAPANPVFLQAEKEFSKKNFRKAERAYARFVQKAPKHIDVPQAIFQRARALYHLSSFDESLKLLRDFLESKPGLLHEARCRRVLAELYEKFPQWGFRRGKKIHFNREHREGQQVSLWYYNRAKSVRELETSRLAYQLLVSSGKKEAGARPGDDLVAEAVNNDLELAKALQGFGQLWDGYTPEQDIEPPARGASYDFDWPERKKAIFLFEEADGLALARKRPTLAAEARYQKAVFLMSFPETPPVEWQKKNAERVKACDESRKNGDPFCPQQTWDPGPRLDPLALIDSILKELPAAPHKDRTIGARARILEGRGRFLDAEREYEHLIEKFPKSKYTGDARSSLYEMRRAWFSLTTRATFLPGKDMEVSVLARNVKSVSFKAFEVDLVKAMTGRKINTPGYHFADFKSNFGSTRAARKWFGRKVASWHYEPSDKGDHRQTSGKTQLPLKDIGAYLVLTKGGEEERVNLVVVSDLALVGKQDRGRIHYWVTDALSGKPLHGVHVTVKETYWMNGHENVRIGKYRSDKDGRVTHRMVRYKYASSSNIEAFARAGRRFAFTNNQYSYARGSSQDPDQSRIFSITDRPVYRPGDKVQFKHIVRGYHRGKNENLPGVRVRVRVFDPRNETLYDHTSKTDAYGSLHGEFELDKDAALGAYRLQAWVEKGYGSYQSSGSNFRVEEYKKPEFKVTVTPSRPDARPGSSVKAEIAARYYFGADVAHAKVRYQIYRALYWHVHFPPSRYDWLYGSGYGIIDERPFAQGAGQELIKDGEGQTDEKGKLEIELPAAEKDSKVDYLYTVQAQVTDLSRRTIQGKGEVKVTRNPFSIFARTPEGFYSPGDNIEIEVEALTPQDRPVKATGEWTAFRLTYPVGEKEKEEKLTTGRLKTDPAGRAFVEWKAPEAGNYRFVFRLKSEGGDTVEHKHHLWVTSDRFDPGRFKFQKITLRTDKRTYLRGETIRLMIGVPRENAVVWLSHEGGDEIFEEKVLRLSGTGTVLEIPADETRAPNFFVRMVMVDDGEMFAAQHEVFIPPGEEILEATLTPDSSEHRPGEKGKFFVQVKDHKGNPVKGQLCLSVFDESVLYIQGDTTGDIRSYYYGARRYLQLWVNNSLQIWHMAETWAPKRPKFKLGGLPYSVASYSSYYYRGNIDTTATLGFHGYGRGGGGAVLNGLIANTDQADTYMNMRTIGHLAVSTPVATGASSTAEIPDRFASLTLGDEFRGKRVMGPGPGAMSPLAVREFFADTALWLPAVETDEQGKAMVEIQYPDSVTAWKGRMFVVDQGRKVGIATTRVVTTKKLVARIETPRFLVEGDRLKLAAVIHNGFDHPVEVQVRLHLEGLVSDSSPELQLTVPAGSDMRHDFSAIARNPGEAKVRLTAQSREESDALVKTLPIMEWGSEKMLAASDTLKKPGELKLDLELPAKRRAGSARLTIEAAPSMGGVLMRALPYLIRYPYGCIEQTISRFVPAAVVARTLKESGVTLEQLKPVRGKASIAKHTARLPWYAAVRSTEELNRIIRVNLKRIASMQNPDGGFGWFSGFDSDPYMTAYVILGLHQAKLAGHEAKAGVLQRAVDCLHARADEWKANHLGVFIAYAVGLQGRPMPDLLGRAYRRRDKLSPYGQSLLALALSDAGMKSKARQIVENLADLAWVDEVNQTATFKPPPSRWWLWWFNRVETTAWALQAFLRVNPEHPHVDRMAKWLVKNRSGNRWTSTRDTSMAILALTGYMKTRGELDPDGEISVWINDRKVKTFRVTRRNVLGLEGTLVIDDRELPAKGPVRVKISLSGRGVVYGSAFLEYYTKEDRIEGAGHEVEVARSYSLLKPVTGVRKRGSKKIKIREYEATPLADGATVHSGDLIEVRIAIQSRNDYSYLVFEDFKPAGFETLELKSGCRFEHGTWLYRELRDEKVVHFLNSLPQGSQVVTYRLRAEIPGIFRILPHKAQAMYAPRIRAISDSAILSVVE